MLGVGPLALSLFGTAGQFASNLGGAFGRRDEMTDRIRELKLEKASTIGQAAAKSGASGVEGTSSSTQDYLAGLGVEFDKAIATAESTRDTAFLSGLLGAGAGVVGGAANAYTRLGEINNWWR